MLHTIEPERATLHGCFGRDLAPCLTIEPGDTVRFRTLDAAWNVGYDAQRQQPIKFEPRDRERDAGHCLCGPIAIRGAQPGMTLAVHIEDVRVGSYGWTAAGGWDHDVNARLGLRDHGTSLQWRYDRAAGVAIDQHGHRVRLRPFMGVMGVAP
jgi:acetamidase/formamidase